MRRGQAVLEPKPLSPLRFRAPENVRARHQLIVSLYRQGLSLQECAEVAGLADHTSALHHVMGKCRCEP